jgi:hypothetical protein
MTYTELSQTVLEVIHTPLYLEQYVRFPIIQLRHMVELRHCSSKLLLVSRFESFYDGVQEFGFPGGCEGGILGRIVTNVPFGCDRILNI